MNITTIGLDLAKKVFQIHGVDSYGRKVLARQLRRDQLLSFFVKLQPCLIGMEACSGAHDWARRLQAQGHTVPLMPPQFVKPYGSGEQQLMATQVGPGLVEPAGGIAPRVRGCIEAPTS